VKSRRELLVSALAAAGTVAAERLAGAAGLSAGDPAPFGRTLPEAAAGGVASPARWWSPLPDGRVACGLCFRGCRIPDGARGNCGVRENRGGALKTLVHSRPVAFGLDPIEKKPLFHVLPGTAALSLGTAGCNLHCRWCQNWEISQARPEDLPATVRTPEEIASLAVGKGAPVVACTYSEPTVFAEYVLDIAVAAKKVGVRTVVVSNGSIRAEPLRDLCAVLAAYKVDLKAFSEKTYRDQCGGELKPVLDTLRRLAKAKVWTEIVTLVIPSLNDSEAEIRSLARFVRDEVGPETPVHFTRFRPTYRLTNLPPTPVATLERARRIALAEGLAFAYVGNVPGHPGESTYCPGCKGRLIRRVGMATVENRLAKGACPDCGRAIPGVWS
jgi:pyruvate formate lyase activating enzyme